MNNATAKPGRPRGRQRGLQPNQYAHALLRERVNSDRLMNVREICTELGMSAETFYAVLNGKRPVSRKAVSSIARRLGLSESAVLLEEALPAA